MNNSMNYIQKQLNDCSFLNWFKIFEKDTIAGIAIPIPSSVLEYLRDEIVVLPKECYQYETRDSVIGFKTECYQLDTGSDGYESDDACIIEPEFPEFSRRISNVIRQLPNSCAFLKTKWHSPKDSYWITAGQTLKVKDITDVYQLLKASSIVKQDIFDGGLPENLIELYGRTNLASEKCIQYLVLKEWHEIHPGTEFRCFVRKRNLIAISPRDWPSFHQFIVEQKRDVCSDIISLFKEKIKNRFPLENFVFDVFRVKKDHVLLVDFSPFNEHLTESLAFDWNELNDEHKFQENDDPEFRYLPADCGIQPSKRNNYGIPFDVAEMFNDTNAAKCSDLSSLLSKLQNSASHG